ncbi:hypothetical protein LLG95_15750 [bacterium]|nr:hypothetical protein [bacterium]
MLFTFALAACYESDPVKSLALSPDGSRAASVTAGGVLNILDLRTPGTPIVQYSNQVKGSVGWSPESRQLAFVEQFPRQPAGLWAIDPALQRPNAALLSDVSWKSDPGWLSDGRIVFRSDRGEDQVSVWALDPVAHRIEKLLAAETDITRLWAAPGGDSLVYQTTGPDGANLWLWRPGAKPFQMTSGQRHYSPADQMVSIPADGRGVAFVARGEREPRVFWFDARKMAVRDELVLERVPDGIAALTKGRVAVAMGTDLRIWRPGHPLLHRNLIVSRFEGLPLALPQRQSDGGVTLVVNQSILLSARNAGRLERGVMHVDGIEEMLLLARARVEAGNPDAARSLLDRLWKDTADSSKRYMIAVARGRLERSQQHWGAAQSWLTRAIEIVAPGSPEAQAAELERLCVGAFDQHSSSQLAAGLKDLDAAAASTELARWLAAGKGNSRLKIWLAVGGDVRAERDERAAAGLEMISRDDGWTSHSLAGLQLLLDGEFEPLLEATHQRQTDRMNKLLLEPSMQLALMRALESKNEGGPSHEELSQTILMQMVRRGDTAGARRFVQNDLSRPTPLNGYPAIFSQFVGLDETEPQTYRVVRDVLLAPDVADRLYGRLEDPRERLLMRMSQVKSALIDARAVPAQGWLRDCQSILNQLPVEENGDNLQELARQLFLLDLFEAKLNEQRGRWNEALVSYKRALELIGRIPNEWDALSYEIAASVGLIEMGRGDADLLASFVRLLRSVGDPVLSPIRQPAAIMTALENFDQFERSAGGEAWIRPWIAYGRGLCYSQLDWPAQALYHLTIARRLNPPPALMQRILLEESAVRDGIGQHAMAARLLEGIVRSRVAEPVRAGAMLAQLQAETASGAQIAPLDRAGKLIQKYGLEPRWRRWLWNQLGGDAI